MAQEFYYPISTATHDLPPGHDGGTNNGGANKNASTRVGGGRSGPATHDDATSYVSCITNVLQAFNPDWPGPMLTWDGVLTLGARYANSSAGGYAFGYVNPAGQSTTVASGTLDNPSYSNNGPVNATGARPGAGSWVAADFASDQTFFIRVASGAEAFTLYFTSLWGEISYTPPPSGGFVFLLGLAGLLSLQMIGPMTDYTQFEKFLQWRHDFHPRHTSLTADNKVTAWDEYKSYKAPRFFYG